VVTNVKGETFVSTLGLSPFVADRDVGVVLAFYCGFVALALVLFGLRGWKRAVRGWWRERRGAAGA
jgi:hypothetical protein